MNQADLNAPVLSMQQGKAKMANCPSNMHAPPRVHFIVPLANCESCRRLHLSLIPQCTLITIQHTTKVSGLFAAAPA